MNLERKWDRCDVTVFGKSLEKEEQGLISLGSLLFFFICFTFSFLKVYVFILTLNTNLDICQLTFLEKQSTKNEDNRRKLIGENRKLVYIYDACSTGQGQRTQESPMQ